MEVVAFNAIGSVVVVACMVDTMYMIISGTAVVDCILLYVVVGLTTVVISSSIVLLRIVFSIDAVIPVFVGALVVACFVNSVGEVNSFFCVIVNCAFVVLVGSSVVIAFLSVVIGDKVLVKTVVSAIVFAVVVTCVVDIGVVLYSVDTDVVDGTFLGLVVVLLVVSAVLIDSSFVVV